MKKITCVVDKRSEGQILPGWKAKDRIFRGNRRVRDTEISVLRPTLGKNLGDDRKRWVHWSGERGAKDALQLGGV